MAAKLHLFELEDKDGNLIINQVTVPSVVNSLQKMIVNGWNVSKKQCAFIKYGNKLTCQPEYFGNLMVAKRDADVKEVNGQVVYEGDEFVYSVDTKLGRKILLKHEPKIENQDITKIKGAYAVVVYNDGSTDLEVMTIQQIKNAWMMGKANGNSKAHNNFTDQMCIKTVANRAVKIATGTSDDSEIIGEDDIPAKTRNQDVRERTGKSKINADDVDFEDLDAHASLPEAQPRETIQGSAQPEPEKVRAERAERPNKGQLFSGDDTPSYA
jgi:recombination protein RecT